MGTVGLAQYYSQDHEAALQYFIPALDNDDDSLEAVTSTLQDLRTTHTISDLEQARVSEVLRAIAALSGEDPDKQVLTEIQTDVFLHPNQPHGWNRLAELEGDEYTAEMAVMTALKAIPPRGELDAEDLAKSFAGTGKIAGASRRL